MYFCDLPFLDTSGKLLGDQYVDLNIINTGSYPVSLSAADAICKASNSAYQAVNGVFSYSSDIASLQTLFDTYFAFDQTSFELILGGLVVAFATGFGAGGVIKLLTRK